MENYYPILVIDLRLQVDDFSPKKINYLKNIEMIPLMLDYLLKYLDKEKSKGFRT